MRRDIQRGTRRKGAVLLVVLSMLFMFVIMVLTYVMVTGQFRRSSTNAARAEQRGEEPELYADRFVMQLIRGPRDPHSPLEGQSLLEDVYGNDGEWFTITRAWIPNHDESRNGAQDNAIGQVLVLEIQHNSATFFSGKAEPDFGGRLITVLDSNSPFNGMTTRTIRLRKRYNGGSATNSAFLVVRMFDLPNRVSLTQVRTRLARDNGDGTRGEPATSGSEVPMLAGRTLYMNGAAFDGVDADDPNEPYDAADMYNRLVSFTDNETGRVIPTMHRPAEINAMFNLIDRSDPQEIMDFLDTYVARPLPVYVPDGDGNPTDWRHLGFSGSNAQFARDVETILAANRTSSGDPILGYNLSVPDQVERLMDLVVAGGWDVDNTGDGRAESNWLDPNFPIISTKDGRRYKVLIAPHVVDLDSRVNVNAAGNWAQVSTYYGEPINQAFRKLAGYTTGQAPAVVHGRGYGPAEIELAGLVNNSKRRLAELLVQKYGIDRMPGARSNYSVAGGADVYLDDILIQYSHIGLPAQYGHPPANGTNFYGSRTNPSAYGSPPDVFGRGAYSLTYAGHRLNSIAGFADNLRDDLENLFSTTELEELFGSWPQDVLIDERTENPYQLDLLSQNGNDEPFTYMELSQLLREGDIDSSLGRLANLADKSALVTTHSYEIPAPPRDVEGRSLAQIVRGRITAATEQERDRIMRELLPFELYRGNRLNINRLMGNGRDDQIRDAMGNLVNDRNGVVDDLVEVNTETVYRYGGQDVEPYYAGTNPSLPPTDNAYKYPNYLGRQLLARHLYVLLRTIVPPNHEPPNPQWDRNQWLAQIAVNIVDFRDADATMTAFEYDPNPFDGWSPDGDISTTADGGRVVWGLERPDLLLTESIATHDRRIRDTDFERGTGQMRDRTDYTRQDVDLDQYRIPQGSWWVELVCTANRLTEDGVVPGDLYDPQTGLLDLGRMAGRYFDNNGDVQFQPSADDKIYPVWRVAVAPDTKAKQLRDGTGAAAFDPATMQLTNAEIRRMIWFTNQNPVSLGFTREEAARIFYSMAPTGMQPGQFAVVGPRPLTYFGSKKVVVDPMVPPPTPTFAPSENFVQMDDSLAGVRVGRYGIGQTPPVNNNSLFDTLPCVPIIAAANAPENSRGWDGDERIGLNLTEPLPYDGIYYEKPTHALAPGFPTDSYYNVPNNDGGLPDTPFDESPAPSSPFSGEDARPLRSLGMLATNDYTNTYDKAAYLQRLANPTLPFDEVTNPYITVDAIELDVTVFNGEDHNHNGVHQTAPLIEWPPTDSNGNSDDYDGATGYANIGDLIGGVMFRTLGKDHANDGFWTQNVRRPNPPSPARAPDEYFGFALYNSLGYLNDDGIGPTNFNAPKDRRTNEDNMDSTDDIEAQYVGSPQNVPIPDLGWNDRPYNSVSELLRVPVSSPGRFLTEFELRPGTFNSYQDNTPDLAEFPHLFNWFYVDDKSNADPSDDETTQNVLDYLEVPSPFVNTYELLSPVDTRVSRENPNEAFKFNDIFDWLRPPFNTISRFRNPGKVNLNGASGPVVWNSILPRRTNGSGSDQFHVPWNTYRDARRKVSPSARSVPPDFLTNNMLVTNFDPNLNPNYPTQFQGAVMPASALPYANDWADRFESQFTLNGISHEKRAVHELGMLRPRNDNQPAFANYQTSPNRHTQRNSFDRYRSIQRLDNLTTNQSNVYAVWLTVGFFEVEYIRPGAAVSDGYLLGQELGSDTGAIQRPRFFYIIDRSQPVGFLEGQDLNTESLIQLRQRVD